jgi:hypothetical protein
LNEALSLASRGLKEEKMEILNTKEWEKYVVAKEGQPGVAAFERKPMRWISHFTHLDQAYSSLREGKLCSRLVHDKSRLNKRRISVCWLSPNDWTGKGGFRYGNVGFRFDINTIVKNRICYWIEAAEYEIRAPRILLSMKDYDGTFERYDPSRDDGPWKYYPDNNSHFFNGTICLELLIEDDIDLSICDGVEIKDHSSQYCSIHRTNPQDCAELSMPRTLAGSLFLSRVVSTNLDVQKLKWTTKNGGRVVPGSALQAAFNDLSIRMSNKQTFHGSITSIDEDGLRLINAALRAFSYGRRDEVSVLLGLFESELECMKSLRAVVAGSFGVDESTLLD